MFTNIFELHFQQIEKTNRILEPLSLSANLLVIHKNSMTASFIARLSEFTWLEQLLQVFLSTRQIFQNPIFTLKHPGPPKQIFQNVEPLGQSLGQSICR